MGGDSGRGGVGICATMYRASSAPPVAAWGDGFPMHRNSDKRLRPQGGHPHRVIYDSARISAGKSKNTKNI